MLTHERNTIPTTRNKSSNTVQSRLAICSANRLAMLIAGKVPNTNVARISAVRVPMVRILSPNGDFKGAHETLDVERLSDDSRRPGFHQLDGSDMRVPSHEEKSRIWLVGASNALQ